MSRYYLKYFEVDLTNKCNLRCAGCAHFSPLTTKNTLYVYDLEEFKKDLKRINEIFLIKTIRLLGGEPTLIPNLLDYLKVTVKIFPFANIRVITNGTNLSILDDIEADPTLKYNVKFEVSDYPTDIDKNYHCNSIKKVKNKSEFRKLNLDLSCNKNKSIDQIYESCSCNALSLGNDHKLYVCPILRNLFILESYFNINFNFDHDLMSISIYKDPGEIVDFLSDLNKARSCCYICNESKEQFNWHQTQFNKSEWVKEDEN